MLPRRSFAALALPFAGLLGTQHSPDFSYTSGRPISAAQAAYDVEHYDLALRADPARRTIDGVLTLTATLLAATPEVVLDLDSRLEVRAVAMGDEAVPFAHARGEIAVRPPAGLTAIGERFRLAVTYGGEPREAPSPPWGGGFTWSTAPGGAPWFATSCQEEGADLWWPCKDQPADEPMSADLHFTVPEGLVVAANGRLVASEAAETGWRTWHWHVSTPINTYGIALNVGPYATIEREYTSVAGESFPVTFWVLPENLAKGRELFEDILRQMAWFESVYGPYPFRADKYGVVETPHMGMEHQTIVAYGNRYRGNPWGPDQGFDFLHHHEFSHEWWANLVTARNWNDFWIHEGFGTYAQALYTEYLHGPERYRVEMAVKRRAIANRAPVAPREPRTTTEMSDWRRRDAPGNDVYFKGSWVLHTLRWVLGDEAFFAALRRMAYPDPALERTTDGAACRFATTEEILAIAEAHAEIELDWLFELYLRQPRLPVLHHEVVGDELRLRWKTPGDLSFPMPVPVRVGERTVRVEMPEGRGAVALGRPAADFAIDPDDWVLRENQGHR
ncbi:MAG: M1 family metallopeptidase [Planctomycetota bacterium]